MCDAGSFQPLTESSTCTICGNGTYITTAGTTSCVLCPARTIRNNPASGAGLLNFTAATACETCPGGYVSQSTRTQCTLCPGGRYQVGDSCISCVDNYFAPPAGGATVCTLCPHGFIATADRTGCSACPIGTYHYDRCVCAGVRCAPPSRRERVTPLRSRTRPHAAPTHRARRRPVARL